MAGTGIRRNPEESGGIWRNLEESGVNTEIPVPQELLQKISVTAAKNRNSCDHLQNHVPVKNSSGKHRKKKEILRNPGKNGFFGPRNKFLKTGICNLAYYQMPYGMSSEFVVVVVFWI